MTDILAALLPVIVLLALGVGAAVASRACRLMIAASYETARDLSPIIRHRYPDLLCYVVVTTGTEAARFHALGVRAVLDKDVHDTHWAAEVLGALGVAQPEIRSWLERQHESVAGAALVVA